MQSKQTISSDQYSKMYKVSLLQIRAT